MYDSTFQLPSSCYTEIMRIVDKLFIAHFSMNISIFIAFIDVYGRFFPYVAGYISVLTLYEVSLLTQVAKLQKYTLPSVGKMKFALLVSTIYLLLSLIVVWPVFLWLRAGWFNPREISGYLFIVGYIIACSFNYFVPLYILRLKN